MSSSMVLMLLWYCPCPYMKERDYLFTIKHTLAKAEKAEQRTIGNQKYLHMFSVVQYRLHRALHIS